jgi:DNA-binding HxlR family transcriptional regulator
VCAPGPHESRSYQQFCGVSRALDVLGERWTLLLVRNLLLGPKRYGDLLEGLPGITTNLLARRLHDLSARGLVTKTKLAAPSGAVAYELTPDGLALEPVIMELGRWGARYMDAPRKGDTVDIAWGLLSLKRRYRGGLACTIDLVIGERRFSLRFEDTSLDVKERASDRPDVVVRGSPEAFRKLWFAYGSPKGPASARELRDSGALTIEGNEPTWNHAVRTLSPPHVPARSSTGSLAPR